MSRRLIEIIIGKSHQPVKYNNVFSLNAINNLREMLTPFHDRLSNINIRNGGKFGLTVNSLNLYKFEVIIMDIIKFLKFLL